MLAFKRKDALIRAEQRLQNCFVLVEGMVMRERGLVDGRRQIVGLHVPGDVFGLAALANDHADHDIVALSAVSCLPVEGRWLASMARDSADLSRAVWRELSRDAALSAAWTLNVGQRPAYQRLAYFVCETQARLRPTDHGAEAEFEWPGNQADIGAVSGLSLVHVNRTLKMMEANDLAVCGSRLRFRNLAKLREVADFDTSCVARQHMALSEMLLSRIGEIDAVRNGTTFDPPAHVTRVH